MRAAPDERKGRATGAVPLRSIVALSFGACGSAAALRVCDPLLPRFAADYGIGLGAAAQTVTAFAVAYGVLQLVYGPIGDRFGKYRTITFATVACAITSLACAFAPTFIALVLARMMGGATAGALIPLSLAWIGDAVPYAQRQPVLARFLVGQMFGIALGQLLGGAGADYVGATPVFLVLAVWFAGCACLMWRFAPPQREPGTGAMNPRSIAARFLSVLHTGWARVVLGTVFIEGVLVFGALAFVPTHLHRAHGVPLTVAGAVVMLYGVGGLLFAASSHVLLRRLGEAGLAAVGAVLLMACLSAIAYGTTLVVAAFASLFAGLGFYMLHNTLQVNATQMAPAQRGSSVGLFATSLFVGQSIGVTLAGVLAERFGIARVMLGVGVLLLALGLAFAALRRRHVTGLV